MNHNRDFTLTSLRCLYEQLSASNYEFYRFDTYLAGAFEQRIILRHDVDLHPENSLASAMLENSMGIIGTYYFRIIQQTFIPDIIRKISDLGHEIGYHYEDMDLVKADNIDQHIDLAYESFQRNLEKLRKIVPINTICMHGSPRAKYDNKMIWSKYDYKNLGIIGEPYFDIDFNEFLYLTDTGRKWNGSNVSVRDKVKSKFVFNLRTTNDVINAIPQFPAKIMITIHPQRWNNKILPWVNELVGQNIKNVVKWTLIKLNVSSENMNAF